MRIGKLSLLIKRMRESVKGYDLNLRRRLFAFLLILMVTMLAGIMFLLSIFGVFRFGSGETEKLMQNELSHLSSGVSAQFGVASVQAVKMSQRLSADIAAFLRREGMSHTDLKNAPGLLEPLLAELLPSILSNLDTTDCSGAFIALDATVNPDIEGSEYSRAGLYVRAIDPNASGMRHETRYLLRGPAVFAGDGRLNLQARWDLEFSIQEQIFWSEPLAAYESNPTLPLSRLLYWCSMSPIQGLNEDVMICSVPVLDGDGKLLGVCGFEISQMNFMLRYEPESGDFHNAVFLLSSLTDENIELGGALFAGNNAVYKSLPEQGKMRRADYTGGFLIFSTHEAPAFVGIEKEIRLYPNDSPYAGKSFASALLIPKSDFDSAQNKVGIRIGFILLMLTVMGIAASVFLSKRYVKLITDKLETAYDGEKEAKTSIVEIDKLLEKIREMRPKDSPLPDNLFEDFIERLKTLTPTEKKIFLHYVDGKSASEIQAAMVVSMSTVKKHSGHIYQKLAVASKDDMMLYAELMKKSGLVDKMIG